MLARKALLNFIIKIFSIFTNLIAWYIIARKISPTEIGQYAFIFSFIALFESLGELGFNTAHVKKVAEKHEIGQCFSTFFWIKTVLTAFWLIVVISIIPIVNFLHIPFATPSINLTFILLMFAFFLRNLSEIFTLTFEGKRQIAKLQTATVIQLVIYFFIMVLIAFYLPRAEGLSLAFMVQMIVLIMAVFIIERKFKFVKPTKQKIKEYIKFAAPLAILSLLSPLGTHLPRIFLQTFVGSTAVAYFFGAQKIANLLLTVSDSVLSLLMSKISSLYAQNKLGKINQLTGKTQRFLSLITTPIVVFFIFQSRNTINIFLGDNFIPAWPILSLLLIKTLAYTYNRPASIAIVAVGRTLESSLLSLGLLPIGIFLLFFLIPHRFLNFETLGLGATGAGLEQAIGALLGFIATAVLVYKLLKIKPDTRIFIHLLTAIIVNVSIHFILSLFTLNMYLEFIFFFLISQTLYLGALTIIGELKRQDFRYIFDISSPKGMESYIKEELKQKKTPYLDDHDSLR